MLRETPAVRMLGLDVALPSAPASSIAVLVARNVASSKPCELRIEEDVLILSAREAAFVPVRRMGEPSSGWLRDATRDEFASCMLALRSGSGCHIPGIPFRTRIPDPDLCFGICLPIVSNLGG